MSSQIDTDSAILAKYLDVRAKKELQKDIDLFLSNGGGFCDLGRYADSTTLLEETRVVKDDRGHGYLTQKADDEVEVVVSLTGVLVECDLPPYKNSKSLYGTRPGRKDIPVNRISIAWFGHGGYERSRQGFENIRSHFSLKYDAIDKLPLPVKLGMPILSCENRVVSKAENVPSDVPDADMPKDFDPKDVIKNSLLQSNKYRFTHDNMLKFAEFTTDDQTGEIGTKQCRPEELKVGMVVCVQATPTILPTTRGGNKLILKLRSLLKVSDTVYKRFLFPTRILSIESLPKPRGGLKRAATEPLWINPKRRALEVGDIHMRRAERETSEGHEGSGDDDEETVAQQFGNLTTKESSGSK